MNSQISLQDNNNNNTIDDYQDDDVEINPVTMLLLDPAPPPPQQQQQDPPNDADSNLQMQTYYISSTESTVLIRQLPSQGLSFQLWPAASTLVALLDRHVLDPTTSPLSAVINNNPPHRRRLRILELGSGTGVVGIAASVALGADVTVTDLPHVLPNLQFNVDANRDVVAVKGGSVKAAALGWGEGGDMEAVGREFDLIVGSDVVYHDHLYEPLIETLKYFLLGGGGESGNDGKKKGGEVVFVMGHLRRWKKESSFFKRARKYFEVEVIHADGPSIGSRVGVVVYRFVRKDAAF